MTNLKIHQQESTTPVEPVVRGSGQFSRFTYGVGEPKVTNVLGASIKSMDWNKPQNNK